jgi:tetratricopeptide (TPR) repeat protein
LLTFDSGNKSDALVLLRRSLRDFERLAQSAPDDPDIRSKIVLCFNNIGQLEDTLDDADSARRTYQRGIKLLEERIRTQSGELIDRRRLAALHGNLGNLFWRLRDPSQARLAYDAALEQQKELVRLDPSQLEFLNDLGMTYNNRAMMSQDHLEERDLFRQSLEIRKRLVQQVPTNAYYRRNLARTYQNLGITHDLLGQHDDALKSLEEGRRLLEQVVIEQPAVTVYQHDLAQILDNLGSSLGRGGRHDEAKEHLQRARTIYQKLLHTSPHDLNVQTGLKSVEVNLVELDKVAKASRPLSRANSVTLKATARGTIAGVP